MNQRRPARLLLAAVFAAAPLLMPATVALAQDDAAASNAPAAGGVGVVDLARILTEPTLSQRLQEQGQQFQQSMNQQLQALQQRGQQLQEAVAEAAPDSDDARDLRNQISQVAFELQYRNQFGSAQMANFRKQAKIAILDAARKAVAEVARERGLSVVIQKSIELSPQLLQQGSDQDVSNAIQQQTTLYVSPGADITGEVIQKMNASDEQPDVELPPADLSTGGAGNGAASE